MINNKKIEEAKDNIFNKHFLKNNEGMICIDHISEPIYLDYQIKQAIELGAHWAINEFLKDLVHPASEEPKDNHDILVEFLNGTYTEYAAYRHNSAQLWSDFIDRSYTTRWLYIADLFPKEEGENEKE